MKTAAKQFLRILLLPLAVAVTAYFCSRTGDGEPLLFYIVLSVIGIIHCLIDSKFQKRFFNLQMLGIYFLSLLTGFSQSELDEMGGMLYYIAGAEVVAVCITSEIIKWIYRLKKRS
jgi:hypothetical protein